MRIIRLFGNIALWTGAVLGIVAGAVWGAGQLGLVQPLIVISGSMEPEIMTGDLLIARPIPTESVDVGDVVSLPSQLTGKLVTHRVVAITQQGETWQVRMKGDDNAEDDLEPYAVGDEVLAPALRIPAGGTVVSKLMEPTVAVPVLVSLLALLGVSLLDEEPRRVIRRTIDRVSGRSPELDELDRELAAVGVDVSRFEEMDDLDLALFAVGIDVGALDPKPEREPALTG
jgi:signal peptidase I